jgi:hypothetical protein
MPVPERERGARPVLSALATGAFAFLLTAAVLHTAIRKPLYLHADARSEKLEMLKEWHGKVFSAAFGSSHVHGGFAPSVFDRTLAGSPVATRSANLGIAGGSQSEQRAMALEFVKQLESPAEVGAPPQPCLVMLEIGAGANFTNDHLVHPRAINIYDWQTTRFIDGLVEPSMSRMQRIGRVGYAVAASGLYYLNIGMLSNAIFSPPLSQQTMSDQTIDDRRGQAPAPEELANLAGIAKMLDGAPAHPTRIEQVVAPGYSSLIAELAAASRVSGVSFVYFAMPKANDGYEALDYPDHLTVQTVHGPTEVPIINLARTDRFPQFYKPTLWHDVAHFDVQGADLLSSVFAQQLKLWYAAHGMPHPCGG